MTAENNKLIQNLITFLSDFSKNNVLWKKFFQKYLGLWKGHSETNSDYIL